GALAVRRPLCARARRRGGHDRRWDRRRRDRAGGGAERGAVTRQARAARLFRECWRWHPGRMRVREYEEAARFVDALRPLWEPREAELNLMLGIALALLRERSPRRVLFASLEQDGTPVGAVIRT